MPVANRIEATKAILESTPPSGRQEDIPIITVTAHTQPGDRKKFLEAGMDDYLAKPVQMEDLQKALERVISNEKA